MGGGEGSKIVKICRRLKWMVPKVDASLRQRFSGNAFSTLVEVIVFTLGSPIWDHSYITQVSTFFYQPPHFHEILGRFVFFFMF